MGLLSRQFTPDFQWMPSFDKLKKLPIPYSEGLRDCLESLEFLDITLARLEESNRKYHALEQVINSVVLGQPSHTISQQEDQILETSFAISKEISLDYQNFYVHARILMDRLCHLTKILYPLASFPTDNFTKHRESVLKNPKVSDYPEAYSQYIILQTAWYGLALTPTRDNLIVHASSPKPYSLLGSSGGPKGLRPLRMNWGSNIVGEHIATVNEIKSHHLDDKQLQDEENFWNIIDLLTNKQLSQEDERKLRAIKKKIGTTAAPLDQICAGIVSYMEALVQTYGLEIPSPQQRVCTECGALVCQDCGKAIRGVIYYRDGLARCIVHR